MSDLVERLIAAVSPEREHTAIVVRARYQPVGGPGRTVMPPTYPPQEGDRDPAAKYLIGDRLVDGHKRATVVIDQEPSQANRVEESLRDARDEGKVQLPMFELRVPTKLDEIRLTSFDFPHRYADAYLRDSLVDGVRFDVSPVGQRLRTATVADVRPLFQREPGSLIFGAWDSHRKGRWPKFARLYSASMFGLDPVVSTRRGGRMDAVNLTGTVDDKGKAEADWRFIPEGTKQKGNRLSEIGHGNIAPNPVPGGVTVSEIRRVASISLAGLQRLRFGDASTEAAILARAALAALALAGDRLAFGGPSVWLRSGCDLAKAEEHAGFERPGSELDELSITAHGALDAFHELRDRAAAAGVAMSADVISVQPMASLREAIEYAVTAGVQDAG
ncbi:MAG: type I-U CRISPR-associated RAMP protein Csb1/Cas7u [Streptosporangiales bacterium]